MDSSESTSKGSDKKSETSRPSTSEQRSSLARDLSTQISNYRKNELYGPPRPLPPSRSRPKQPRASDVARIGGLDPPIPLGEKARRQEVGGIDPRIPLGETPPRQEVVIGGFYGRPRALSAERDHSPPESTAGPVAGSIAEEDVDDDDLLGGNASSLPILTALCSDPAWVRLEYTALARHLWHELHRRQERYNAYLHSRIWDDATGRQLDLSMGKGPKSSGLYKRLVEAVMEAGYDGEGEAGGEDEEDMAERLGVMEGVLRLFVEGNKTAGKKGVFDEDG